MEKWERHMKDECKGVHYQFEVVTGRFEDISGVVGRAFEECRARWTSCRRWFNKSSNAIIPLL